MNFEANGDLLRVIRQVEKRLGSRRGRIVVPDAQGLHRRRPGAFFHPFPELFFQTGGAAEFECPSGRYRVEAGDLCLIPPGVPHAETPFDTDSAYGIVVFMQNGADCLAVRARSPKDGMIEAADSYVIADAGAGFRILEHVNGLPSVHPGRRADYVRGLVQSFFAALGSLLEHPESRKLSEPLPRLVGEAEKLVRMNLSRPDLTVSSVAKSLACSPDHLSRLFLKVRGMTLNVWLAQERIQTACDLLERSRHNVSEIAWACGFRRPSYFIRLFRAYKNMTPREWREQAVSQTP